MRCLEREGGRSWAGEQLWLGRSRAQVGKVRSRDGLPAHLRPEGGTTSGSSHFGARRPRCQRGRDSFRSRGQCRRAEDQNQ